MAKRLDIAVRYKKRRIYRYINIMAFLACMGVLFPLHVVAFDREIPAPVNKGTQWKIYKKSWDEADEEGFSNFVYALGQSDCDSLHACLKDAANPYRNTDRYTYSGDCADMVYILRAYYAWKNGLPFSHQALMAPLDRQGADARYSTKGNKIVKRRDAVAAQPLHAPDYIAAIGGIVSTAMFRTHPGGGDNDGAGVLYDDFYPVPISRKTIRPGTVAYDIYGHVGLVYDVTEDGRVLVFSSHPDLSVTRSAYGPHFLRAKPALGAGLKNWRPVFLEGANQRADGVYVGGKMRARANDQIETFSLEQFYGNKVSPDGDWRYGDFVHNGRTLSFYDYVRRKLARPDFAYHPVEELRHGMKQLCRSIQDRRVAVRRAIRAGVHKRAHPEKLPKNIYGTHGSWENYSTPSRDARLKISFIDLRRTIANYVMMVRSGDKGARYEGADLPGDLWAAYEEEEKACTVIYRRTDNSRVRLNFGDVNTRLFDLSFDPYHCPELRWGARGVELETCSDGPEKRRWYEVERFLRYQAERTYDVRMDFALNEIKPPSLAKPEEGGLGVEAPANADIRGYLADLVGVATPMARAP